MSHKVPDAIPEEQSVGDVALLEMESERRRRLRAKMQPEDENLRQLIAKVRNYADYKPFVPRTEDILARYDVDYFDEDV